MIRRRPQSPSGGPRRRRRARCRGGRRRGRRPRPQRSCRSVGGLEGRGRGDDDVDAAEPLDGIGDQRLALLGSPTSVGRISTRRRRRRRRISSRACASASSRRPAIMTAKPAAARAWRLRAHPGPGSGDDSYSALTHSDARPPVPRYTRSSGYVYPLYALNARVPGSHTRSLREEPAVDHQLCAGDVGRLVGGQVDEAVRDLVGCAPRFIGVASATAGSTSGPSSALIGVSTSPGRRC